MNYLTEEEQEEISQYFRAYEKSLLTTKELAEILLEYSIREDNRFAAYWEELNS
ncbi:hypothetical protein [Pseudolactococcus insecticola]|uniref:Uncharacterized protein n=1 Tax=Pseudolactococcus insecticola TaxID=2709158 RepID=A0A6A0B773_9LACT|nr:hypothetical protein [Lactococcus insecticola]GFH40796.1 hypothetical protein Hs20B_11940 [Lactococcus insecticola]